LSGFGERLRQIREQRGMTQQELAQAIGGHWVLVSRYERGVHLPPAAKIVTLAEVLHVTADALLRGDRKGEEPMPFENIRLFERFRALDKLPKEEQETVLRLVDTVLGNYEWERMARERIAIKRTA
jgi:transcriptional regulator with XRE-family HTH domain